MKLVCIIICLVTVALFVHGPDCRTVRRPNQSSGHYRDLDCGSCSDWGPLIAHSTQVAIAVIANPVRCTRLTFGGATSSDEEWSNGKEVEAKSGGAS